MEHIWQSGEDKEANLQGRQVLRQDIWQERDMQQEWSAQAEQLRIENERYRQIFEQLVQEEEKLHAANQERIKNGIHCLFLIPMLFFALLFLTKGEKAVFLLLWILSLFATAAYMIYIEYMDFQVKERLQRYTGSEELSQDGLIGADLEEVEKAVAQLLQQIDEKKALRRRKVQNILRQSGKPADAQRKDTHYE